MTLVVADTGPIRYLVAIDAIAVLGRLYDRVVLPKAVLAELTHPAAPTVVRNWVRALPSWVETGSATRVDLAGILDPGEAEAIALAGELAASLLLDETEARKEALRRGLAVAGTIGVLERAAQQGLLELHEAFERLAKTNFRIEPGLIREALSREKMRRG